MPPTQDAVREAIVALKAQHPQMGKKWLLKALNINNNWSITSEDLRSHLEAIAVDAPGASSHSPKDLPYPAVAHSISHGENSQPPTNVSVVDANGYPRKLSNILADVDRERAKLHGHSVSGSASAQAAKTNQKQQHPKPSVAELKRLGVELYRGITSRCHQGNSPLHLCGSSSNMQSTVFCTEIS